MNKWEEINVVAHAMAKRNGCKIDAMRPSTGNRWRELAEAGIKALDAARKSDQ